MSSRITEGDSNSTVSVTSGQNITLNATTATSTNQAVTLTNGLITATIAPSSGTALTFTSTNKVTTSNAFNCSGVVNSAQLRLNQSALIETLLSGVVTSNLSFTLPSSLGSNGQYLVSNGSGGMSWQTATSNLGFSGCKYSVVQNLPNPISTVSTSTTITFGASSTQYFDTNSYHSTSSNPTNFYIPFTGLYCIIFHLTWPFTSAGFNDPNGNMAHLTVNGVTLDDAIERSLSSQPYTMRVSTVRLLSAGNVIAAAGEHNLFQTVSATCTMTIFRWI